MTTPTTGMNIAQRILHVGGRNNAAGYVEFGSTQAVEALVRQVLRDLPSAQQEPVPDVSGYVSEWRGGLCTSDEAMSGIEKLYAQKGKSSTEVGVPTPVAEVVVPGEQQVFECWLSRVHPSGDAEDVHAQWRRSGDYLEWLDASPKQNAPPQGPEFLRLADAIDPFVRKTEPDHLMMAVAAHALRIAAALT